MSDFTHNSMLRVMHSVIGKSEDGPTDAELLTRFLDTRDSGAFECLVWRHGGMVFNVCRAIMKDHHTAEDAVQAVFLALARGGRSITNRHALAGWLHRIARRIALRAAERARRAEVSLPKPEGIVGDESISSAESESFLILHDEIARLPEIYQTPIVLCFFEGLSHPTAAKRLGCPLGTLKGRVDSAKKLLAKRLAKRGVAPTAAGIAGVLLVQSQTSLKAEFVATIVRSTAVFASGASTIPGISSSITELARDALKPRFFSPLISRLVIATAAVAGLSTLAVATDFGGLFAALVPASPSSIASPSDIIQSRQVLAPIPKGGIDAQTIARYEASGAFYGGFKPIEPAPISTIREEQWFEQGEEAANNGIPGFCWNRSPMGEFPELPQVDCDFGIEIHGACDSSVLKSLKSLKKLCLLKTYEFETDFRLLAELKNLKSLNVKLITNSRMLESQLKKLAAQKNLQSLTLYTTQVNDACVKELTSLEDLRSLTLASQLLTNAALKDIARLEKLETLNLATTKLTDDGIKDLAQLKNLRSLYLGSVLLGTRGVENLATLKHLQSLTLDSLVLNDDARKTLSKLSELESLNLKAAGLSDSFLNDLTSLKNLKSIHMGSKQITDAGVRDLAGLKNLHTLSLQSPLLTDAALKNLSQCEQLHSLALNTPLITDSGVKHLASVKTLRMVVLSSPELTDTAAKELAVCKNLQSVVLSSKKLTDAGVKDLTSLENLQTVVLTSPEISDAAAKDLASLKNLRTLHLFSMKLTDDAVKHLSSLHNLQTLVLHTGVLSDASVKEFASLVNLQSLQLPNAEFSQTSLKELHDELPRCMIICPKSPRK